MHPQPTSTGPCRLQNQILLDRSRRTHTYSTSSTSPKKPPNETSSKDSPDRIVDTLRELGAGFAFAGRQVHFDIDGGDFYVDLLFFHTEQLRY